MVGQRPLGALTRRRASRTATGALRTWGTVDTKRVTDAIDISLRVRDKLSEVARSVEAGARCEVVVEDFMKAFGAGRFRTQSLFKLAQVNSLCTFHAFQQFGTRPRLVHANSVRSMFGLRAGAGGGDDAADGAAATGAAAAPTAATATATATTTAASTVATATVAAPAVPAASGAIKLAVFRYVQACLPPDVQWQTTARGKFSEANFDMADAYLLALYAKYAVAKEAVLGDAQLWRAYWALRGPEGVPAPELPLPASPARKARAAVDDVRAALERAVGKAAKQQVARVSPALLPE